MQVPLFFMHLLNVLEYDYSTWKLFLIKVLSLDVVGMGVKS